MSPSAAIAAAAAAPVPGVTRPAIKEDAGAREDDGLVFLSTAVPTRRDWRLASAVVIVSILVFIATAPFAAVPMLPVLAFIPAHEAALVVGDLVTAIMLFGQVGVVRSRALLALASGYLFTALIVIPHVLTLPGLFSATGLLGAGVQSTAWLYMAWHAGFPLAVMAYALLKRGDAEGDRLRAAPRVAIPCAIVAVLVVVCGVTWLTTAGESLLPAILAGNRKIGADIAVAVWMLSLIGLGVLLLRRPYAVLDLWLMVVLCAWLFDMALSAIVNTGRFDLGFYAGRIYGLLAASFVLGVMLMETNRLYGRLAIAAARLKDYAGRLERRVHTRTAELETARSINQRVFETAVDLIVITDRRGSIVEVSPSCLTIIGYRPEELIGRSSADLLEAEDLESTRSEVRRARQGELMRHFEARYIHKEGRRVPLAWTGVWSAAEERYFFTGRDMTERIASEEQLRQAQKMEAVGQLTGGVAHDFNNLLGVVVGNLDLLQERVAADAESAELLEEALGAALRGADVTRQLLAFSRRQPLLPKIVAPNEIVRGMSKLLSRAIGEQIQVRLNLPEDAWPVHIDAAQLEAALLNLAVNARDAMPGGGSLTIETSNLALDAEDAESHVERPAGDYVMVAVSDSGTGMPPEIVARVFEPFFSTKGVGKGTGLGLSMVYGFVKQSGGNARIYSEVGVGTTIRLYLPRADVGAKLQDAVPTTAAPLRGCEKILVVEDNEAMRRLALRQLRDLGYETLDASTGPEAMAKLAGDPTIDLLFTDIVMPGGMDGRELARQATTLRPAIRVLFTSGFTAAAASATIAAELADRLVSKPYRKTELAWRIRSVLDDPGGAGDQKGAAPPA